MRKAMCVLIALTLLCLMAIPAQAGRLEDMQARYAELTKQKASIETQMIRLEGAFAERLAVEAETKAAAEALAIEAEAATAEEALAVGLTEAVEELVEAVATKE